MTHFSDIASLSVSILAGRGLAAKDRNGFSDPFCKLYLLDEKRKKDPETKRKTPVQKKTLNPEWNATFNYVLQKKYKYIRIQCWDKDRLSNDFLGELEIPIAQIIEGKGYQEGWMELQQQQSSKKQERISGEIRVMVQVISSNLNENAVSEKKKASKIIEKLFGYALAPIDIFFEIPCTMVRKERLCGSLVASKPTLCFYSDPIKGKRKAREFPWHKITNIEVKEGELFVEVTRTNGKTKTHHFEDLVDPLGNFAERTISKWEERKNLKPEARSRKSGKFRPLRSNRRVKTLKADASNDNESSCEYADMTDFTEFTELTEITELSDISENNLDEGDDLRTNLANAEKIRGGGGEEGNAGQKELPLTDTGSIAHPGDARPSVQLRVELSKNSPGQILVGLIQCQDLPAKPSLTDNGVFVCVCVDNVGNTCPSVEISFRNQIKISKTLNNTLFPIFNENYHFNYSGPNEDPIVVSVWHNDLKTHLQTFLGETLITMEELQQSKERTVNLSKELKAKKKYSRNIVVCENKKFHAITSVGRICLDISFDLGKQRSRVNVIECQRLAIIDPESGPGNPYCSVKVGKTVFETRPKDVTINPIFDEPFEFTGVVKSDRVLIQVFYKTQKEPYLVGTIQFSMEDLSKPITKQWYELTPVIPNKAPLQVSTASLPTTETNRAVSFNKDEPPSDQGDKKLTKNISHNPLEVKRLPSSSAVSGVPAKQSNVLLYAAILIVIIGLVVGYLFL